jgi:integrase
VAYAFPREGKDGKTRYTAVYRDITGRARSAGTFDTEKRALREAIEAEADVRAGRVGDPQRAKITLRTYVEQWLVHHVMEETTKEGYVYLLNRYILPELGDIRLRDLDPERVRAWVTRLTKVHGANPPTVRNTKTLFDAIMSTLVTDRVIHYHPGRGVKTPPVATKPRRIIDVAQYQRLRDHLPDDDMRLLVETDIETGLRWGELTELRPKDIDWTTGLLTVSRTVVHLRARTEETSGPRFLVKDYPKDKEWRQVKLAAHLLTKLRDHIHTRQLASDDLLFPLPEVTGPARRRRPEVLPDPLTLGFTEPNEKGRRYRHGTLTAYQAGRCRCQHCKDAVSAYRAARRAAGTDNPRKPRATATDADRHMSNDWFRTNVWNPALTAADLGFRVTPHGLRHAHASWLLAGGADLQVVKERLGHGSIMTTEKYLHTLPGHHDAALAALDNIRPAPTTAAPTTPPSPLADQKPQATTPPDAPESMPTEVPQPAGGTGPDTTALLAGLSPDLVRLVLTGLLQQIQPDDPVSGAGEKAAS